jgi:hypothetical protein
MGVFSSKNKIKCDCRESDSHSHIDYFRDMILPLLVLVLAWFATEMDIYYHPICIISLVVFLALFALFTWE